MKKLKKIMLLAAALSFLPATAGHAVNANQYLSADMFKHVLNWIGPGSNAGLKLGNNFFSNTADPFCSKAKISLGFPSDQFNSHGSSGCLKLADISSGNGFIAESFYFNQSRPTLKSIPFDRSTVRKKEKYNCGNETDTSEALCYSIKGFSTAGEALEKIIELADEHGNNLDSLQINDKTVVRVDGYAVVHVRQFSMGAASRFILRFFKV